MENAGPVYEKGLCMIRVMVHKRSVQLALFSPVTEVSLALG